MSIPIFTEEDIFDNFEKNEELEKWFSRKTIGSMTLSVVAGRYLYSEPSRFLDDVRQYKEFEFAIIRNGKLLQIYDRKKRREETVLPYYSIEDGLKLLNYKIAIERTRYWRQLYMILKQ
jgi:hypothetical protein